MGAASYALFTFLIKLLAGIANYVAFVVCTRVVGPDEFGTFSTLISLAMLGGMIAGFGQQMLLVKELPSLLATNSAHNASALAVFSLATSTVFGIACAGCAYLFMVSVLGKDAFEAIAVAVFVVLFGITQTTIGFMRVMERTNEGIFTRDVLWRILFITLLVLLPMLYPGSYVPTGASAMMIFAALLALPAVWQLFRTFQCGVLRNVRNISSPLRGNLREWLSTSGALTLVALISSADPYIYTILLGEFATPGEVGAFFAALKSVELINMFLMAVTLSISTSLSVSIGKSDIIRSQQICNEALLLQLVPTLCSAVPLVLFGSHILSLFSPSFSAYGNLLIFLSLGMLINALTGATVLIMQVGGMAWLQVAIQGICLLLSAILIPLLWPALGIYAAAASFVVYKLIWNVLAVVVIYRRLRIDPSVFGLLPSRGDSISAVLSRLVKPHPIQSTT